ncbi:RHS repeat-associated core domain-containing protein, partial [Ferviditalea candida]|nr:RHS repeat-associated core domain-containing protein [Paenibacillaceae bacterium T2]
IGYIGDLGTGNGSPGSLQGPVDENGNIVPDYTPNNNSDPQNGSGGTLTGGSLSDATLTDSTGTLTDATTSTSTAGETTVTVEQEPTEDITTELVKLNPYRYAGYYWDRKTQYYYLQARYYDPRNGRFLSADTFRGEIGNPLSLHLYAYSLNNPVNYLDPSGHDPVEVNILLDIIEKANNDFSKWKIESIQQYLKKIGFYQGEVTGRYNSDLYNAVLLYQMVLNDLQGGAVVLKGLNFEVHRLPETGLVDDLTFYAARLDANIGHSKNGRFQKVMLEGDLIIVTFPVEGVVIEKGISLLVMTARYLKVGTKLKRISKFFKSSNKGKGNTVDDILSDATLGRATKGKTTQYEKIGGNFEQANKEFDSLNPSNVKDIETKYGPGKTGTLPDGRTITVRPGSSDGRPTLEIRNTNGRGIEIRYGKQSQ